MRCVLEGCALLPWRVEHRLKKTFVEGVRFRVAQVGLRRFAQTFFLPPATSPPSPAPESRRGKASHRGHGASLRARIRQVYLSFRFAARRPRPFARVALHATRRRTRRAWRPVTHPGVPTGISLRHAGAGNETGNRQRGTPGSIVAGSPSGDSLYGCLSCRRLRSARHSRRATAGR